MSRKPSPSAPEVSQHRPADEIARAEAYRDPEHRGARSKVTAQQLLHDLRVHQIELELQNDELRRAQHEIEASRSRYVDLYDLAPVGYLTVSERGLVLEANLTASVLLGVTRHELVDQQLTRFVLPDDQDIYFRLRKRLFKTATEQVCELRVVKANSGPFWVRLQAAAPQVVDGALAFRAVLSDVTERKRAEETLRASEARHRILFERSYDGLVTLAPPTWGVTSANSAAIAMLGVRDQADLASRPLWLYSPERQPDGRKSSEKAQSIIDAALREGSLFFDWTFERVGGGEFAASVLLTRMEIDCQPLLQATVRDETEIKKLQSGLAQADRLASMGMLAAGVAHEINNPLTYVLYNAETLAADLPGIAAAAAHCSVALRNEVGDARLAEVLGQDAALLDPEALENAASSAREVLVGATRIRDISQALGTFSRVEQSKQSMVDLNYAIECAITMAFNEIKYRATLIKDLGPVPLVWASEGKLSQVFLNLLMNASGAIEEGHVDRNRITIRTWVESGEVFAEVTDTGKGISPENLPRVFEPFFTTKPTGLGSGLGLAICKTIIAEFGGDIRVESQGGRATRFVIRLQIPADRTDVSRPRASPATPAVRPERGRLLVIDDEELVLKTLQRLLGREHEVLTAASGEDGRAILQRDQSFDVILCDLMMPDLTGMDLHAWVAKTFPALAQRMVFLSGGAFTPKAAQYLEGLQNLKISKPHDSLTLKSLVSELVASFRARSRKVST